MFPSAGPEVRLIQNGLEGQEEILESEGLALDEDVEQGIAAPLLHGRSDQPCRDGLALGLGPEKRGAATGCTSGER